jgi:hypothetical protein
VVSIWSGPRERALNEPRCAAWGLPTLWLAACPGGHAAFQPVHQQDAGYGQHLAKKVTYSMGSCQSSVVPEEPGLPESRLATPMAFPTPARGITTY